MGTINTRISYLYRDADNYKMQNSCVIMGVITEAQIAEIISCLDCGEYFIPRQVGLLTGLTRKRTIAGLN